jgi:stage III sporulation protein SpoIIIAA
MQVAKNRTTTSSNDRGSGNHMPQVIIIDEIGTELEVLAARTIAEKVFNLLGRHMGTVWKT